MRDEEDCAGERNHSPPRLNGQWLRSDKSQYEKVAGLFVVGASCIVIGWCWNPFFPINKALWTSSYVFFTGGLALEFLGMCYWLIDIKKYRRWAKPFVVFGVNAIALYVGSAMMEILMERIELPWGAGQISLQGWIFQKWFLSWAAPVNASLAFAVCFILVWLGLMWLLYTRKIFIRV